MRIELDFKLGAPKNPINKKEYVIWDNQFRIIIAEYWEECNGIEMYSDGDEYYIDVEDVYAHSEIDMDALEEWRSMNLGDEIYESTR